MQVEKEGIILCEKTAGADFKFQVKKNQNALWKLWFGYIREKLRPVSEPEFSARQNGIKTSSTYFHFKE